MFKTLIFLLVTIPLQIQALDRANDDGFSDLRGLLEEIMVRSLVPFKCVMVISDGFYNRLFDTNFFGRFNGFISFLMINVEPSEDLLAPSGTIQNTLQIAKTNGCQLYIILIANGVQTCRFLRFGERYRLVDTRSKFIFLHDNRLFDPDLFYIWKRIVNVIFLKLNVGELKNHKTLPWIEITTVPFPYPIRSVLVPKKLDIWRQMKFRKNIELFQDKTSDLRNETLKIVAFAHSPGTSKLATNHSNDRTIISDGATLNFTGTEIEILKTVADTMNFRCDIYEGKDADRELWGRRLARGKYTGLIGEMTTGRADVALGDLYYTPYILDLLDLTVPYHTVCLTFLTPESLFDNSWKTLILPFKGTMWACVLIGLLISALAFHLLALFQETIKQTQHHHDQLHVKKKKVMTLPCITNEYLDSNRKYTLMKKLYDIPKYENQAQGLYQFSQPINSLLYTYSMLLLVSLPKLPTGWSLRMMTGWYWLYCLLVVVAYRASMTAILSRPTPRVTIDTLQELMESDLICGGLGEINREFFKSSLDPASKTIGNRFVIVENVTTAVDQVAMGTFAFYENNYFLKEALVQRQLRFQALHTNFTANQSQEARDIADMDRTLHIMTDCVIKMPISIGLQKNSPIKPRVDRIIRKVIEAGLVKKWLNDQISFTLNAEVQGKEGKKALMDMKKFSGALVALFIGYFLSCIAFLVEMIYFHYFFKKKKSWKPLQRTFTEKNK